MSITPPSPILIASDLSVVFSNGEGGLHALDRISFAVVPEEFVCVLGPSGSGKSTLLRVLSGLLPPTQGEVIFEGAPLTRPRRRLGFVFQKLGPKLLLPRFLPNRPTRSFSNWVFLVVSAARCLVLSWFRGELMKMLYGLALHPLFTFGSEFSKGVVAVCSIIQDRYLPEFKQ